MPRSAQRTNPVLSPNTAKALVASFNNEDLESSASESPDSLYSNSSPTFQTQSFEFDVDSVQETDDTGAFDSPQWGKWPETTTTGPGWSPSPPQFGTPNRTVSIISLSPRGSPQSSLRRKEERRDSNPSLLGFELSQRRRSSIRSFTSSLRRSSVVSSVDTIEEARLRNVASMSSLGRRYSEVVEVTCPSDSEGEDTAAARGILSQWSPYSTDNESDYSEILTASCAPTPDVSTSVPAILSNFPLASVAQEPATPSDMSASPIMPRFPRYRRLPRATPSPEPHPVDILRSRARPNVARAVSDYHFPARVSAESSIPPGAAAPRLGMVRAVSTGTIPTIPRSIPLRSVPPLFPLGTSPLREILRRESTHSEGEPSRRSSTAERKSSLAERRASLAERRASLVIEARRGSAESGRRNSTRSSRKSSIQGIRRTSVASTRSSRKGSWVESAAEFAYLAPQIVIEQAEQSIPLTTPLPFHTPSFALTGFFHTSSPSTPTPRFNPMESFLGTAMSSPASTNAPLSPSADSERTPTLAAIPSGVINRGRPVSPPEFTQSFPFWNKTATSPKSVPVEFKPPGILRKAVPKMSLEEMSAEAKRDEQMRLDRDLEQRQFERRGATMFTPDEQALLRGAGAHRRTASDMEVPPVRRPVRGRQWTMPVELEQSLQRQRRSIVMPTALASSPEEPPKVDNKVTKRTSVTFNAAPNTASRPNMNRTSSFSRFFHSRSKSVTSRPEEKIVRPPVRPISTDSSGSDRTLVEVREIFRKLGVSSPKKFSDDEGKVPVSRIVL